MPYDPTNDPDKTPVKSELVYIDPPLADVSMIPSVGNVMDNALITIHREVETLAEKAYNGGLDPKETRQFSEYVKALQSLVSMRREMLEAGAVEQMPDDELMRKVQEVLSDVKL